MSPARNAPARSALRMLARIALAPAVLLALLCAYGCGTRHPQPIGSRSLAEAQTFPYYRLYWAGPSFAGRPLVAVDGSSSYNTAVGDSLYYGDCVSGTGLLGGGGSCELPLQVTTVIYRLHDNSSLGPQRNTLIRGVPATIYDEGRSIELYSGRVAIDLFSNTPAHALAAASRLRPVNAPGSPAEPLPPPVYCPGLSGPIDPQLRHAMDRLPGHPCQLAATALARSRQLIES